MLLNEFLEEHRKVQQLEANDAEQQREIKALVATVKEQCTNPKSERTARTKQTCTANRRRQPLKPITASQSQLSIPLR